MRFLAVSVLVILTTGLSFWNFFPRSRTGPAALQVFSKPDGQVVFLNDEQVGVTPYKNQELKSGEIKLAVGSGSAIFSRIVKLTPNVFTIVNRELSENLFLQAGEILNLEPGTGLVVLSTPDGANVEVDEKKAGQTPVKLEKIAPGEYKVVVTKENYISRAVQVQVHKNYRLILDLTLASTPENLAKILGPTHATQSAILLPKVKILPTSTGFLRVRNNPSFGGAEIVKVSPSEEFTLLEEKPGWFKIRLTDGREGWISAQYAQKL